MENGSNPDHRFVDRVEETISVPSCRQFTKSELENWVDISTDSIPAAESSFRETAYLNNLSNGNGENGFVETEESSSETIIETQVTDQACSSQVVNSSSNSETECSIDHVETILDAEGEQIATRSVKVKASKQQEEQTSVSTTPEKANFQEEISNQESLSQNSDNISETDRELFFAGANVQPFVTVDPSELLSQKSQSKQPVVWGDFHSIKQTQDSQGSEQFEKIFQEQINAQKEKECKEQKIMDKLLGTIPAYRGDWKHKEAAEHGQVNTASSEFISDWKHKEAAEHGQVSTVSSEFGSDWKHKEAAEHGQVSTASSEFGSDWKHKEAAEYGQASTASSEFGSDSMLVSGQQRSVLLQGHASETHTSAITQEHVTVVSQPLQTSASYLDQSEDIRSLEKAVISQGSVLDPSRLIEVERKFIVTEKSEFKLKELGATLLSEKKFNDTYYDTSAYKLTLNDCWLRLRGNKWELKTPVKGGQPGTACSQYNELTDEHDIVKELSDTLALDSGMSNIKIQELVHIGLLSEFCHLTTTRKSYGLKSCSVDLDITNFGFQVGEIEVIVLDQDRIPEALETIERVAKELDFQPYAEASLQVLI